MTNVKYVSRKRKNIEAEVELGYKNIKAKCVIIIKNEENGKMKT